LLSAVDAMFDDAGVGLDPHEREIWDEALARVHAVLDEDAADEAFEAGRSLQRSEALAEALKD
jgi:hypothetical protein